MASSDCAQRLRICVKSQMRPLMLDPLLYRPVIEAALREDLGAAGDVTSAAVIAADSRATGRLVARQAGRIAGLEIALDVFRTLDPGVGVSVDVSDGVDVAAGTPLAVVRGLARPMLTAERTALNILTRLSGIATATAAAVALAAPHGTRVACTRKTTPGLRALEKYAVRAGGGTNHRFGLHDGVMIKDNHIVAAGGIGAAVARARQAVGHMMKVEVEVDSLDQLSEALDAQADAVLLDNMPPATVAAAVEMVDGRAVTEASGGIAPDSVGDYAAAGVDVVSLGWLTHSVTGLDIALDFA